MGTKNTLLDLKDYLFMQIERLSEEDLTPEQLNMEIGRSKAMALVATQIVSAANTVLDATKFNSDYENKGDAPRFLIGDESRK